MKKTNKQFPSRGVIEQKYNSARSNLFIMIALTVINLIVIGLDGNFMMLFSASFPLYALVFSLPPDALFPLQVGVVIAVFSILLYIVPFFMSKKHYGWMIVALILFSFDSMFLIGISLLVYLGDGSLPGLLEIIFHVWVMYYLISGVRYGHLRTVVPEEEEDAEVGEELISAGSVPQPADMGVKAKILLEAEVAGYHVCYRRVKRTNELIIDGYVYDEITMALETAHNLQAMVGDHLIEAGFDGRAHSYIRLDGNETVKKLRLI